MLLERIWHVVALVAEAIGADVCDWDSTLPSVYYCNNLVRYDWDSTLQSASSRMECLGFDGVHPSMQVGT